MTDFSSKITIDAVQAIGSLEDLDRALGNTTLAMGVFQGVADKSIGGQGFARLADSSDQFGKKATAAMNNVSKASEQAAKKVQSIGLSFRDVGRIVESQIIFAAISGLRQAFFDGADAASEFQLQIARIAAISDDLNFDGARAKVEQLAKDIGRPLEEVGAAAFEALQNDLNEFGDTFEILRTQANDLALVTGGTLPQAVNALSSVFKTYGNDLGTTNTAAEQFFGTINAGRITLADLESSLGTLAPLGSAIGVSFKELTDSLATITLTGTQANVATTQLRNIFNKLIKPTEALQAVYEKLGVAGFRQLSERAGGFKEALAVLQDETKGSEDGLARLFNTIRANVGVLNVLTDKGTLYEETAIRSAAAAKSLRQEIENINATDARQAQFNAAELEVIYTRLGDKALSLKVALGNTFLDFIDQSELAIAVQGGLAAGLAVSTTAFLKFGVAATAAFPPLAAFTGALLAAASVYKGIQLLSDQVGDLGKQSSILKAESLAAYAKALDDIRADEIKEVTDAFEAQDTILNRVAKSAKETADSLRAAFDVDIKNIGQVEANLLSAFGDARSRVLKEIRETIKNIDDEIADGTARIQDIRSEIEATKFEFRIESLSDAEQASARLLRAAEKTAFAFAKAANAGLSKESADAAREASKLAIAESKAALSAAERTKNTSLVKEAQQGVLSALRTQETLEVNLNKLRTESNRANLEAQAQAFETISATAKTQVEEALAARNAISDAVKLGESDVVIDGLKEAYLKEVQEAKDALGAAGNEGILKLFDLDSSFQESIRTLQEGLKNTTFDWNKAVDDLRNELANAKDLKAAVQLVANVEGLAGEFGIQKLVQDAIGKGGTADVQLQNIGEALKGTFAEGKKFADAQRDAVIDLEAGAARVKAIFDNTQLGFDNLNTGALEAQKLIKPIEDALAKAGDLSEAELVQLNSQFQQALVAIGEQTTGFLGTFTEKQKQALIDGTTAAIATIEELLANRKNASLFNPQELARVEALIQKLSATEVTALNFAIDEEGISLINETLEKTEQKGINASAAVAAIGTIGRQAEGAINLLGQTTLNLVGQANSAESAYRRLRDIAQEAVNLANQAAQINSSNSNSNQFFGGRPTFRNDGGSTRGTDTVPVMANPEEFFVNAKSSRNFLPELQAINAGNAPNAGVGTGDTNITIGDINVSSTSDVPSQTARDIALSIKRELRRGTSRL